jgi:hypothetical protein
LLRYKPGPTVTGYRDWLIQEVDKAIYRAATNPGWGDVVPFVQCRTAIHRLVPDQTSPKFAIKHGDFNPLNVLVNECGLTGLAHLILPLKVPELTLHRVIDWDTACVVPAPSAIQHPLFIANIPGINNDNGPEALDLSEDRAYLEDSIRRLSFGDDSSIADLLTDSFERQFFELSLRNKRVNTEYVKLRGETNTLGAKDLFDELQMAFHENPSWNDVPALAKLLGTGY